MSEFPHKIDAILKDKWISGSLTLKTLDNEIATLLAKVESFYATLCKINWKIDQELLNSVGFSLNQSHFRKSHGSYGRRFEERKKKMPSSNWMDRATGEDEEIWTNSEEAFMEMDLVQIE
ncbi:hypothetical protein LIER_32437 [Lithospermum erythrorhizon]|uniref:Uncharacterized protein n=1 Tax=Lithospermum erythrorhizon TaxID=34254 RepID=A0AAV3RXH8_LITER